ncbi:SRPBCC domain-containing protein [Geodermatophilus sp. SYSU D01180]
MDRDDGLRLTLRRVLRAPPGRVFRMLTEPGELARWWGPRGFTLPGAEVDLRVGGRYRLTMRPPGAAPFHLTGRFLAVDPGRGLSYTFRYEEPAPDDRETVVTLVLAARGGETVLSLTQEGFATREREDLHRAGWSDSLDRLEEALAAGPG